jgi:DNA-binding HxlR family transcriptional regulator
VPGNGHTQRDRWTLETYNSLQKGSKRFGQLAAIIPGISRKILTEQLKELEQQGMITRTEFKEIPPRVVYELTTKGQSLKPLMDAMSNWGNEYVLS